MFKQRMTTMYQEQVERGWLEWSARAMEAAIHGDSKTNSVAGFVARLYQAELIRRSKERCHHGTN